MNEKIIQLGSAITEYILSTFEHEYLHSVFGGVIDADDLVDQVILECIKKAFDATEEKHSLRYYFKINGDESKDDVRMRFSRLMAIVNDAKKKELEYLKSFGIDLDSEEILKNMDSISDKLDGYELTEMNFFEINNVIRVRESTLHGAESLPLK